MIIRTFESSYSKITSESSSIQASCSQCRINSSKETWPYDMHLWWVGALMVFIISIVKLRRHKGILKWNIFPIIRSIYCVVALFAFLSRNYYFIQHILINNFFFWWTNFVLFNNSLQYFNNNLFNIWSWSS